MRIARMHAGAKKVCRDQAVGQRTGAGVGGAGGAEPVACASPAARRCSLSVELMNTPHTCGIICDDSITVRPAETPTNSGNSI